MDITLCGVICFYTLKDMYFTVALSMDQCGKVDFILVKMLEIYISRFFKDYLN